MIHSHGKLAVVTDDFGNAVRYKDDVLEDGRSMLAFSVGDLVPYGAQIKSACFTRPYFKEDNGVVFVFDAKTEKWIKTDNESIDSLMQYLLKNNWFKRVIYKEDWNYNIPQET